MYSEHHALVSLGLGGAFAVVHPDPTATGLPGPAVVTVVGYAVVLGVGIDLDHFLVQRLVHGEWSGLRRAVASPRRVFLAQSELFAVNPISPLDRLLSHVVIVGLTVPATWLVGPALGLLTAVTLYGHLLSDLAWDVYRRRVADGPPHPSDRG